MGEAWKAFLVGGAVLCAQASCSSAAAPPPALALHECRLAHPLRLASLAARCGSLKVPLDRSHPRDASIDLSIAVIPALNRRADAPPLFLLAGGPGQGAIAMYSGYAAAFARINRNHDIVLVDQRGTGHSSPLLCSYSEDWQARGDLLPEVRQATTECLHKYGDAVRFYTSSAAVEDLAAVRQSLAYTAIDLYGVSYGTRVAELYMRRFPESVRAVILDGVTYPEQTIGPDAPRDGERALGLILARCRDAGECAAAYPGLQQELTGLRREFGPRKAPIIIDDPNDAAALKVEFNRGLLSASLRFMSYSASQAALLPALIHQAANGTFGPLAAQAIMTARQVNGQLASGMQNSVICTEDVPFFTPADLDRSRFDDTYQGRDQLDALLEICKLWPRGPVDPELHRPLKSDLPTLLLSGEADPITPPANAARLAAGLSRKLHLVLTGEGHGQVATGCIPRLMADFLDRAVPETLDASCLQQHRPPPFFVSMTGPAP